VRVDFPQKTYVGISTEYRGKMLILWPPLILSQHIISAAKIRAGAHLGVQLTDNVLVKAA